MLEDHAVSLHGAYTPPLWNRDAATPAALPCRGAGAWLVGEEDGTTYSARPRPPAFPGLPSALVDLALSDDVDAARRQAARAELALETLCEIDLLARAHASLAIRQGRLLAHIQRFDSTELGYPSYAKLRDALTDWKTTWTRGIVRLLESGLDDIIGAARLGRIPLSVAVRAAGRVEPDQQRAWIADVLHGCGPWRDDHRPTRTVDIDGDQLATVHAARSRARLLDGTDLSNRAADCFILDTWHTRRSAGDLLRRARQPRPPPELPPLAHLEDLNDPADQLLGPFEAPTCLDQACTMLREVQSFTRDRGHRIGLLWKRFTGHDLQHALGYRTLDGLVRDLLDLSLRQLQDYRRLADQLELHPQLQLAYDQGMAVDKILLVAAIATRDSATQDSATQDSATADTVDRWLAVARRTRIKPLRQGIALAADRAPGDILASFEHAIRRMEQLGGGQAQDSVALRAAMRPPSAPSRDRVHPDLPRAAAWFLDHIQIPSQHGCGRIKESQQYTCQNPDCNRRWIGNHAHHIQPRSQGGADDEDNLNTHCPSCHLRLIHTGRVRCTPVADALLWTYPGRRIWVF